MTFHQNQCLSRLPPDLMDVLGPRLRPVGFVAGQVLFSPGNAIRSLYFMTSGAVSLVTPLASGMTVEFGIVGRSGVIGGAAALADGEATYQAIVQIDGGGYALDVDAARRIARQRDDFRALLVRHEQLILFQAQQSSACNAVHDVEQRFSRCLVQACDAVGGDSFRLTQELMSEMLGVRRTSVTAVAQKLQQAGLISYVRGRIKIERLDALRACACECYAAVKTHHEMVCRDVATITPAGSRSALGVSSGSADRARSTSHELHHRQHGGGDHGGKGAAEPDPQRDLGEAEIPVQ